MILAPMGEVFADGKSLDASRRSAVHGRDKGSSLRQEYASPQPTKGGTTVSGHSRPQKFISVNRNNKGRFANSRSGNMKSTMTADTRQNSPQYNNLMTPNIGGGAGSSRDAVSRVSPPSKQNASSMLEQEMQAIRRIKEKQKKEIE